MQLPEAKNPQTASAARFFPLLPPRLFYLTFIIVIGFALRVIQLNHLPLSLSLDEATNGLDAWQLFRLPWLTPFLQNNFGRETAFFYVQGLALWLYGLSFFALRFASVVAGTLTIPLLYMVAQRLQFDDLLVQQHNLSNPPKPDYLYRLPPLNLVGLLAATGLAVSYWHIFFSRLALRAILLPPLLLGLVWCFWQGWRSPAPGPSRRVWLAVAGFLLGLTFYSYLAARLLPLIFLIFGMVELVRNRGQRSKQLIDLIIFGLTATLVMTPLILYFRQNPQAWASRTQAISIFATARPWETLASNFISLLQIDFAAGIWLGQWPAPHLMAAMGLVIGLPICLYHFKKPAMLLLLLWGGLGLAPVLLSIQDWTGQTTLLRGIVAWPALVLMAAIGLATLARWLHQQASKIFRPHPANFLAGSPAAASLIIFWVLLIVGGLTTVHQYFFTWATNYNKFSDHPARIAEYLNSQTSQLTLTPLKFYAETVANFLLQARYPTLTNIEAERLQALLASTQPKVYLLPDQSSSEAAFVLLAPAANGHGTAYLLPSLRPEQVEALARHARTTPPLGTLLDGEQEPIAQLYPLPSAAPFLPFSTAPTGGGSAGITPTRPIGASFGQDLLLSGYQLEPTTVKPGETVTLTLLWQAQQPVDGDYYLFIHLFNILDGQRYGQINTPLTGILFDAHRWPVGLLVPDPYRFTLPLDAAEGVYRFEIGLYHAANQQRLPVVNESTQSSDDKVILGNLQVWVHPPAPPQLPLSDVQFGQSIALVGVDLPTTAALRPGQELTFTLHWQALAPIAQNYTIFTHLLDAADQLRAQQDNIPLQGHYPTSWWEAGELVRDTYTMLLPPDLEPGQCTLRVGLYLPETGRRLPLKNGPADFVDLPASITIQP